MSLRHESLVIGAAEFVDLPDWGIRNLRAKVDTGARSSALHVENIREIGGGRVQFEVRLHRKHTDRRVHVEAKITRRGRVRPSSGHSQIRLFVATTLRLGPIEREVELSLVDREKMIYRMLLGRTGLAHGLLVDPGHRYLLGRSPHPAAPRWAAEHVEPVRRRKKKDKRRRQGGPVG